jgi:hypothetical protein
LSESAHFETQRMTGALFRMLGQRLAIDGEQLNRLSSLLAEDLHAAGFRLPQRRQSAEAVAATIYDDLLPSLRAMPEYAGVPRDKLRYRLAALSLVMASRGYRRVAA